MANCSIPNSSPVSGRISMTSLRRSRKQNSAATSFLVARSRAKPIPCSASSLFKSQRPTPNAQRSIQTIRHWTFDVQHCEFSAVRRVKGAWWPSRSSKPSSPRKWRGRFDSYPLRQISSRHPERRAAKSKDRMAISRADSSELQTSERR